MTTRGRERRRDVQGLRALAVLLVVAFHSGLPLSGGFVGVDVFFVISGFVIARLLITELQSTSTLALGAFYARRVRRLLPALTVVLVVVCAASCFLLNPLGPQQATANTSIGASLFTANLELFRAPSGYFDFSGESNALLHTWSLSVEEQFYFVFPGCLLVLWRLAAKYVPRTPRLAVALLVFAATIASFALCWYTSLGHGDRVAHALGGSVTRFTFYLPATRAWEFGIGILVALGSSSIRIRRLFADYIGIVGVALIGISALLISGDDPFPGTLALLPVLGTALVIVAGTNAYTVVASLLSLRPLVWIGDLSYGWYLWHWPLIVFARAAWPTNSWTYVVASLVAIGPTWLSYRFVENPIRFANRITGRRAVALVAICLGVSVVAALGLRGVAAVESDGDSVGKLAIALRHHADELRGCSGGPTLGTSMIAQCTWPVDHAKGTVFLVGDSNAGQFTEPAAWGSEKAGYNFTVATAAACPFVDLIVTLPRHDAAHCHAYVLATLEALERSAPALVIIASSASLYVDGGQIGMRDPYTEETARTAEAKARLWKSGVQSVLTRLTRAGIPTVLVHPAPRLEALTLNTCPFFRFWNDVTACELTVPRAAIEDQQRLAREAEKRAVAAVPTASSVDFTDDLCSSESCPSRRGEVWLYRDFGHLSVAGALSLSSRFARLIADHARGTAPLP